MNIEKLAYDKGYEVTPNGRVISPKGKQRKTFANNKGFERFSIFVDGNIRAVLVHRLQGYMKYGDKLFEHAKVIRHANGDVRDNSLDNIVLSEY